MKKIFISDIKSMKADQPIDSFFSLAKKAMKRTKTDKPYLEITFADKSGKIEARAWDDAEKLNAVADTGDVVRVKGQINEYKDEKQIKVDAIIKAPDSAYSYEDMVRVVENMDGIMSRVMGYLDRVANPWIKSLVKAFLEDKALMERFASGAGGKMWHNAYVGGLAEHTYEVMFICDKMCELYPEVDRDTLILGAFLHDIGKIYELDEKKMDYTIDGSLLGHIAIGHKILSMKISRIDGFPRELAVRLEHIILSHHGEYEQQSPVLPKTLEATVIYQADELVSQTNAIKELMLSNPREGRVWSDFIAIKNRKYFVKDQLRESWRTGETEARPQFGELFG
jgi:3'-5' exoribonuclease